MEEFGAHTLLAGAIWSGTMPSNLARELPQISKEERDALFGSITDVLAYPRGSEIREGVINGAYCCVSGV